MRAILVVIVLVVVLGLLGWLRFSSPEGNPTLQLDTNKVERDTSGFIDEAKKTVDKASDEAKDLVNGK